MSITRSSRRKTKFRTQSARITTVGLPGSTTGRGRFNGTTTPGSTPTSLRSSVDFHAPHMLTSVCSSACSSVLDLICPCYAVPLDFGGLFVATYIPLHSTPPLFVAFAPLSFRFTFRLGVQYPRCNWCALLADFCDPQRKNSSPAVNQPGKTASPPPTAAEREAAARRSLDSLDPLGWCDGPRRSRARPAQAAQAGTVRH